MNFDLDEEVVDAIDFGASSLIDGDHNAEVELASSIFRASVRSLGCCFLSRLWTPRVTRRWCPQNVIAKSSFTGRVI